MNPTVVHIHGPTGSGKTTLGRILAARSHPRKPHLLRIESDLADRPPHLKLMAPLEEMASCRRRRVNEQAVFEDVPDEIRKICNDEPGSLILVETDAEPCFRHAYPYDVRVFVMQGPTDLSVVFRSPSKLAETLEKALDDTAEFAAEIFGLAREPLRAGLPDPLAARRSGAGSTMTAEEFLESDMGIEIASRLQLQPIYHSIVDSDVILLNEALSEDEQVAAQCKARIEVLLARLQRQLGRKNWFAVCDPLDVEDPLGRRALERIESLIQAAHKSPA